MSQSQWRCRECQVEFGAAAHRKPACPQCGARQASGLLVCVQTIHHYAGAGAGSGAGNNASLARTACGARVQTSGLFVTGEVVATNCPKCKDVLARQAASEMPADPPARWEDGPWAKESKEGSGEGS